MSSGDAAAENQLLDRPRPPDHPGPGRSWDEHVPTPGRDATLLAVVPIPGTGTSLAIVAYAVTTSPAAGPAASRTQPDPALHLDHTQRRAWTDGREIPLTFQEFELLAFLAAHPGTVFTRAELVERVWHRTLAQDGRPVARDSRTVDVHVSRLRRKLGPRHGQCLVTEYRVGYRYLPRSA
ncbi:MAG TPA: winged helix-turn-helix domain-containing protein [Streptosporangiaceae bacterium]|nr:winged helix-turn-helix domain-containing protein [Streptosporangiaceae bacterium]